MRYIKTRIEKSDIEIKLSSKYSMNNENVPISHFVLFSIIPDIFAINKLTRKSSENGCSFIQLLNYGQLEAWMQFICFENKNQEENFSILARTQSESELPNNGFNSWFSVDG